jgi:MiaB/RimO family radical SAM methylthiotransferase
MPFVSEALWPALQQRRASSMVKGLALPASQMLAVAAWPDVSASLVDAGVEAEFERVQALVDAIRNVRGERQVQPRRMIRLGASARVQSLCTASDGVIAAMAEVPTVCEHIHLPMQSGSTSMLKKMLRRYSREDYLACVERMRAAIPGLALTTDIIVGFPSETDEEFADTLSLCQEVRFDDAFMFKFSPREGTPATRMPAEWTIPNELVATRFEFLLKTVRGISRENNMRRLGDTVEVLIEKIARDGQLLQARSRDFKTIMVPADAGAIGDYLTVKLTGTTGATFVGTPVVEQSERKPLPMMAG